MRENKRKFRERCLTEWKRQREKGGRGKVMKQNEKIDKRIEREASNLASPSGVTDWAQPVSELLIGRLTL
jgi:hypothetical protein